MISLFKFRSRRKTRPRWNGGRVTRSHSSGIWLPRVDIDSRRLQGSRSVTVSRQRSSFTPTHRHRRREHLSRRQSILAARKSTWNGSESRKAREYWRALLPLPCCRCGRPVFDDPRFRDRGWQVDHWPIPRELGGTETRPAHSKCNLSAGGKRGAEITNSRRRARRSRPSIDEISMNIRGV